MSIRSKLVLFCLLVSLSICSSLAASIASKATLTKEIEQILTQYRRHYHLPGLSVSIKTPASSNIKSYTSGFTTRSNKRPITPDTLFQVGSITKTFVASMIFQLIEQKKLTLHDKISKWLPQYPGWGNVSIADLLRHTSGISNYTAAKNLDKLLNDKPQKQWLLRELADIAYQQPKDFTPGSHYNYTNTDYIVLGLIIEKISEKNMQQVFNDYLKRYQLNHSVYNPLAHPANLSNNVAHGYNEDGTLPQGTSVMAHNLAFLQSAGGLMSTPHDIVLWLEQLFSGSIISVSSLAEMITSVSEKDVKPINLEMLKAPQHEKLFTELGSGAGIGLVYLKHNGFTWMHSGGTLGFESLYVYSPCNGIYLALTYNLKPKSQFIFMRLAAKLFNLLNHRPEMRKKIKAYQRNRRLPKYCNRL